METKVCKKCGRELPVSEFYKSNKSSDGLQWWCKDCLKQSSKMSHRVKKNKNPLERFATDELRDELISRGGNLVPKPTPREMMQELARLGYKGKLTFTRIETIDIENF